MAGKKRVVLGLLDLYRSIVATDIIARSLRISA